MVTGRFPERRLGNFTGGGFHAQGITQPLRQLLPILSCKMDLHCDLGGLHRRIRAKGNYFPEYKNQLKGRYQVPGVADNFNLLLPAAFTQPGAHLLAEDEGRRCFRGAGMS